MNLILIIIFNNQFIFNYLFIYLYLNFYLQIIFKFVIYFITDILIFINFNQQNFIFFNANLIQINFIHLLFILFLVL